MGQIFSFTRHRTFPNRSRTDLRSGATFAIVLGIDPTEYLRGEWTFGRRIRDHLNETGGSAGGSAVFEPSGAELLWHESGWFEMGGGRTSATRDLIIARGEGIDSGWVVLFDDRRPFHPLTLIRGVCEVDHPCREDNYHGRFRIVDDSTFETSWQVDGPAKNHLIETTYRRVIKP